MRGSRMFQRSREWAYITLLVALAVGIAAVIAIAAWEGVPVGA